MAAVGGAGLFAATDAAGRQRRTAARPGHERPGRVRLTVLGTTDLHGNVYNWDYFSNADLHRQQGQQHRRRQGRDAHQGGASRARRRPLPHARRRRHHPGHPAGLLLRQDRPDHRGREAPDGHRDERRGLRRRRAGQPRVQLRPRHPARLRAPVRLPAAVGELGRLGHRRSRSSRRTSSSRSSCPAGSRSRSASSAWSRPAWRSGTPPTSRARCASPASSSRRRSWCRG